MNATELKRCRQMLGLTQSELARLLRLAENGDRSIRHYEAGKRPVPGPVSVVLDMLCNGYDPQREDQVLRRMLDTPHKPHMPMKEEPLRDGDFFLVVDGHIRIAHVLATNADDGSITADLYRNLDDYNSGAVMERSFTFWR